MTKRTLCRLNCNSIPIWKYKPIQASPIVPKESRSRCWEKKNLFSTNSRFSPHSKFHFEFLKNTGKLNRAEFSFQPKSFKKLEKIQFQDSFRNFDSVDFFHQLKSQSIFAEKTVLAEAVIIGVLKLASGKTRHGF